MIVKHFTSHIIIAYEYARYYHTRRLCYVGNLRLHAFYFFIFEHFSDATVNSIDDNEPAIIITLHCLIEL